jgi:hypothetical protein
MNCACKARVGVMLDLDAPLRKSPRPLPMKIPAAAHVLSHSDLRAIAKHFVGRDDPVLGEELVPHILHRSLFGADSGRVIPKETLVELGEGDPVAGRKVVRRFIALARQHGQAERSRGGAVHADDILDLNRIPAHEFRRLRIGGVQHFASGNQPWRCGR